MRLFDRLVITLGFFFILFLFLRDVENGMYGEAFRVGFFRFFGIL